MAQFGTGELARHYAKHKADFPGITEAQYEKLAAGFLLGQPTQSMLECQRKKGDMLRYDSITKEFGVLSADGIIRSYFKPAPCASLAVALPGGCHGHPTNEDYFHAECKRQP